MRRDLQETFIRLVDTSIQLAGRAVEQGGWLRRTVDSNGGTAHQTSRFSIPVPDARLLSGRRHGQYHVERQGRHGRGRGREATSAPRHKPSSRGRTSILVLTFFTSDVCFAVKITDFLARRVLADFRRFLIDTDKTVAVCSNMVYYIVAPSFKTRSKSVYHLTSRSHSLNR